MQHLGCNTVTATKSTALDDVIWPSDTTSLLADHTLLNNRYYNIPSPYKLDETTLVYIGAASSTLTSLLMTNTGKFKNIYSYDPTQNGHTLQEQNVMVNAQLRRRYKNVLRARDAGTIGIIIGTLGVAHYLSMISQLQQLIKRAGKKPYLFAMGKINPAKMANFTEVGCFVHVACTENSMIEDLDFYKPIITPYELAIALGVKRGETPLWTGELNFQFDQVLQMIEANIFVDEDVDTDEDEEPHFSLVTGRLESSSKPLRSQHNVTKQTASTAVLDKSGKSSDLSKVANGIEILGIRSTAAEALKARKWQNVAFDEDGEEKLDIIEGRSGLARAYD